MKKLGEPHLPNQEVFEVVKKMLELTAEYIHRDHTHLLWDIVLVS